jgi:hypothetical protein
MRNMALPIKHEDLILTDPCYSTVNLRLFVVLLRPTKILPRYDYT